MADPNAYYRIYLKQEFSVKKKKNPRYSIRAFARYLLMDSSLLAKIMNSRQMLSADLAEKICKRLKIEGELRRSFLLSVVEEQKCHILYLIDPELTDCDPDNHEVNTMPPTRKKK